ncbi:MAG TPA: NAD-dependent epimerase/dehydratase family protein [Chitinophagales bacterium]|nr:NAD-dependent epimerase/dehydratase family protein [Chitinophagales bacterium]
MKQILITGITGLIGRHLMHKVLHDSDYKIIGQYFSPRNIDEYTSLGVNMKQADICNESDIKDLCKDCDVVVHSAAKVMDYGTKEDFYLTHYDATKWLLTDALNNKVRHFIYISSFGPATYIDRSNGLPDETIPLVRSEVHYDNAKIDTEDLVISFCTQHDIKYTIIRPAAVIGPDSVWIVEPLKRAATSFGLRLINHGKSDACLLDAENLAEGIYLTITLPIAENQIYFFEDEYEVTWDQYFRDLLAMKGLAPKGNIPSPVALILARNMEKIFLFFNMKPPISLKSVLATSSNRKVIVKKARQQLGWESKISYQESMRKIQESLK